MSKAFLVVLILLSSSLTALAQSSQPLIINRLTINKTHIAFSYAGDVWSVPLTGGDAKRLTTSPNEEDSPVFSPDGSQLAFSRLSGGSWDVYVMPAGGGEERRLTYLNKDDHVIGWTPDGKEVLFQTIRNEESLWRLYKIAVDGVMPEALPLPQAMLGSFSPDGNRIAYNPRANIFGEWRYYRGGMTATVWIADLKNGAIEKLSSENFNDLEPMWVGGKIYFISDRTGVFNLFAYDLNKKKAEQLTSFDDFGIRTASSGSGTIAFVKEGRINVYEPNSNKTRTVDVRVSPDTSELKPRTVNAARWLDWAAPSFDGSRVVVGARGEIFDFNPTNAEAKNLTQTSGAAERFPASSPDGKYVAYFSDESGEYELHIRPVDGASAVKKIAIERQPSFYRELTWSPDGKKIAFTDKRLALWIADIEKGTARRADSSVYSYQEQWFPNWSHDSRWLTYSKHLHNRVRTVFILDVDQNKVHQITDGITHTESPVFDANGKYLYFVSSPNAGTSEYGWGVLKGVLTRPLVFRKVHALVLDKETPSLLLPNGQRNSEAQTSTPTPRVQIDFDEIEKRFINLPLPARDYSQLIAGKPGKFFAVVNEWPSAPGSFEDRPTTSIYLLDTTKDGEWQKIAEDVRGFEISRDGARLLYSNGRDWFLTSAEAPPKKDEGKLNFQLSMTLDPSAEWRQIYHEAWRIMRDWFYDPNYHGHNLAQLERRYAAYLPAITRRTDLNQLMRMMLGHISVSHLGVGGGDTPPPAGPSSNIGGLGADYEIANGRYRFKKIYRSMSYNGVNGTFNAPLDQPGIPQVREGEYLLAVDGQDIVATKNIYSYFENKAGRPTKITIGPDPGGKDSRAVTVYPVFGENRLRRANWAEQNRQIVEKMSGGKLGYIFVENYGSVGVTNFIRGLSGYSDRAGVIVDQRFNGGGITPDYLIEWLQRQPLYYYMFRAGDDIPTPVNPGPLTKVLIVNEHNGSAAETFAFMYKLGKVGPIVGKRTHGGGIGPYVFTPRFTDGGRVQLPNRAAYNPDGSSWGVENVGVAPDYDVEITPQDFMSGRDSQLEKAVQVALAEVAKIKQPQPKRPAFPVHPALKNSAEVGPLSLPLPGSAFPIKEEAQKTNHMATLGYADYLGQYESPLGLLTIKFENGKLIGNAGGEVVELVAESARDTFKVQTVGASVKFVRDESGKVIGIAITKASGDMVQGKKIN